MQSTQTRLWPADFEVQLLRAVFLWTEEQTREERAQAAFERRGQAALDALRRLGRDYPRPKNY